MPDDDEPKTRKRTGGGTEEAIEGLHGLPERYVDAVRVDRGGMGEVYRVRDTLLERDVAVKIPSRSDEVTEARFRREAILTARLRHEAILPLYDVGRLGDGRLWYSMELAGSAVSLWTAIYEANLSAWRQDDPEGDPTLRRLVGAVHRAASCVAHAHARGILHRDVKPPNILLDGAGQAWLIDWGIAEELGVRRETGRGGGTRGYGAPEQLFGDATEEGTWTDVWALGATLYTVATSKAVPDRVSRGLEPARAALIRERGALPPFPTALGDIVEECLVVDRQRRIASAELVALRLGAWIAGEAMRTQARLRYEGAQAALRAAGQRREDSERLRREAAELLESIPTWAPAGDKAEAWTRQFRAQEAEREAVQLEAEFEAQVRHALEECPGLSEARGTLVAHHEGRATAAEVRGEHAEAERHAAALRAIDPRRWERWFGSGARLDLDTDPPGAEVLLFRFEEHLRVLEPVPVAELGPTPLRGCVVPAGSLLLEIRAPGHRTVRLPLVAPRGGVVDVGPDGASARVALPREDEVAPGCVWIPGGWTWVGGDPDAADALPRQRVWVPGFAMGRDLVTVGNYLDFLQAMDGEGRLVEAELHAPRNVTGVSHVASEDFVRRNGRWEPPEIGRGRRMPLDWPVVHVSWHDAQAYAAWRSTLDGRSWGLPYDLEWERAARGADGRRFPWGNAFDDTFTNMVTSHQGAPTRVAVGTTSTDVSVFGVRDLAGNAREWSNSPYRRGGVALGEVGEPEAHRVVKGGCFGATANLCRLAARLAARPESRQMVLGFRLKHG